MSCPASACPADAGPTGPTTLPRPRAAPKTATSPRAKAASRAGVLMSGAGHRVAGLLDGGTDGGLVDRRLAGHGQPAAAQVDRDVGDAGHRRDRKSTPSELQSRQYLVCRLLLEKTKP